MKQQIYCTDNHIAYIAIDTMSIYQLRLIVGKTYKAYRHGDLYCGIRVNRIIPELNFQYDSFAGRHIIYKVMVKGLYAREKYFELASCIKVLSIIDVSNVNDEVVSTPWQPSAFIFNDDNNLLTSNIMSYGKFIQKHYWYNANGCLAKITNVEGDILYEREYNDKCQLISEHSIVNKRLQCRRHTYNEKGLLLTTYDESKYKLPTHFVYDNYDRLVNVYKSPEERQELPNIVGFDVCIKYLYDTKLVEQVTNTQAKTILGLQTNTTHWTNWLWSDELTANIAVEQGIFSWVLQMQL